MQLFDYMQHINSFNNLTYNYYKDVTTCNIKLHLTIYTNFNLFKL